MPQDHSIPARRRFIGVAAATLAAGSLSRLAFASIADAAPAASGTPEAIRPLRIHVAEARLTELRRRVRDTQWPERETVDDASQGVQLATMQALARRWAGGYDWRRMEARLNALPQFVTGIDGLDIHFIHVRSKHRGALPMIVTHGWPGSIIEQLKIIGPLTDPTAHGGSADDAFDLVIPSLPGYGFSGKPSATGWDPVRIARVFQGAQEGLTQDDILDNITLYWLTRTGVSSARLYWENKLNFFEPKHVAIPVAVSVFPDEIYAAPRSWAEQAYPKLIHYQRMPKGGHFAAWEQPLALAGELRTSFRSLR
ncbi:epoxide hydrolase family protein [Burkholderia gladioli]|uniref:epoxide hydrolase family protein n=1 Tax=Burkholderia gladioli TaxID=28095 RepID=UPI00163E2BF7|nr:epoxide hydrolase N-terminal domain-containing protein [Burkholderia gladioli]